MRLESRLLFAAALAAILIALLAGHNRAIAGENSHWREVKTLNHGGHGGTEGHGENLQGIAVTSNPESPTLDRSRSFENSSVALRASAASVVQD